MKRCPFCAEEIQEAAILCRFCGRDLPRPSLKSVGIQPPASGPSTKVLLACIGAVILLFVALGVTLTARKPPNAVEQKAATSTEKAPAAKASGNRAHDLLIGTAVVAQHEAFAKLLAPKYSDCTEIRRVFFQGIAAASKEAFWNVECGDGRSYVVTIQPDATGSTAVLDCALLKYTANVDCFRTFEQQKKK